MKVLHITSWYPSKYNSLEGNFIQEHFEALSSFTNCSLVHFQVRKGLGFYRKSISANQKQLILKIPFENWRIIELLNFIFLLIMLKKINKKFDIVNFHIAYPLLTYLHIIKKYFKIPIVLNEHWTAYRFSFHITKTKSLFKLKRIFTNRLRLITVSKALGNDISRFSEQSLNYSILPNVVSDCFLNQNNIEEDSRDCFFFSVSVWRPIKKSLILLAAFKQFCQKNDKFKYYLGGDGEQIPEMKLFIEENNLGDRIKLLGKMNKVDISDMMSKCSAFLHCSDYETFSVVCAEAICSGTPVIASNIPAISEFVDESNGILVENNDSSSWELALSDFIANNKRFDRNSIKEKAISKFSKEVVGKKYFEIIKEYEKSIK